MEVSKNGKADLMYSTDEPSIMLGQTLLPNWDWKHDSAFDSSSHYIHPPQPHVLEEKIQIGLEKRRVVVAFLANPL